MTIVWTCEACGAECSRPPTRGQRPRWCASCQALGMRRKACPSCGTVAPMPKGTTYCSEGCVPPRPKMHGPPSPSRHRDQRGPLRRAFEDGTTADVVEVLRQHVVVDDAGCWVWQRSTDSHGYGEVAIGKRWYRVHRLAVGNPPEPVVHHVCANRLCCNPEHLQLVTQRENLAEMLARSALEGRIRDLERALAALDPSHELLDPTRRVGGASESTPQNAGRHSACRPVRVSNIGGPASDG